MMYVKRSMDGKTDHFRHYSSARCKYQHEPETERHLEMKRFVYEEFPKYNDVRVKEIEYRIFNDARLDVYFELNNGYRIGFECQHSKLSLEDFEKRMEIYLENDIYVIWIFDYFSFLHHDSINFEYKINPELLFNIYCKKAIITKPNPLISEDIIYTYDDRVYFYKNKNIFSISFSSLEVVRDSSKDFINDYVNNENYIQNYDTKKLAFETILPSLEIQQFKENFYYKIALFQDPTKDENKYTYSDYKEKVKKVIDNTSTGYYDKELHHYFTGLNKYELKENLEKLLFLIGKKEE